MYVRTMSAQAFGSWSRYGCVANVAVVSSSFQMYVPNSAFCRFAPVAGSTSSARARITRVSILRQVSAPVRSMTLRKNVL